MISNTHLDAGCVFDADVHRSMEGEGFTHGHVDIALRHRSVRGLDVSLDPDGFVLFEQLRFAHLVLNSIPDERRKEGLSREEKLALGRVTQCIRHFSAYLLDRGKPLSRDEKRMAFQALEDFDWFAAKKAALVDEYFGAVEKALELAEQYKSRGILSRLYRLRYLHPDAAVRGSVQQFLVSYVRPALNYVGPFYRQQSPEELSRVLLHLHASGEGGWNFPSSLQPDGVDTWLKGYERDLL